MNILVIPSLFPVGENDYKGIFVRDYINSVAGKCNVIVYYLRLFGDQAGIFNNDESAFSFHARVIFKKTRFRYRIRHILYLGWYIRAIKDLGKFRNVDLIHVHGSLFLTGITGLIAARLLKVPVVYSEHMGGFDKVFKNSLPNYAGRNIYRRFDAVLIVSERLKSIIDQLGFRNRNSYVVYNPVDTGLFTPVSFKERYNLVYVGRFDKNKGALRVVEAFRIAFLKNKELRLTMIGDGVSYRDVEGFLSEHSEIRPFVILTGLQTRNFIKEALQKSSVLIAPSCYESFGISVAEAMSCGLPVIIGAGTGPTEFVDDKSGVAIDPLDVNAISDAILGVVGNSSRYDSAYIRGRITGNFSFEVFGSRLAGIYNFVRETKSAI